MKKMLTIGVVVMLALNVATQALAEKVNVSAGRPFAGSLLKVTVDQAPLTDASPTRSIIVPSTRIITKLGGEVGADKGMTLVVYTLPIDGSATRGKVSKILTIPPGGGVDGWYSDPFFAPRAEIVITKTEDGDMLVPNFWMTVSGW